MNSGMGSKQFADAVRVQAMRRFDEMHLRYLWGIHYRRKNPSVRDPKTYMAFPDFSDKTPDGFHGYTPSSHLLREIYDAFIEDHEAELDQHQAMRSLDIGSLDHCHKVCNLVMLSIH